MKLNIEYNELNKDANGGTELMQRGLVQRLPAELLDQFQIICSRVRDVSTTKIPILWLHDLWSDPEALHLREKTSRDRFKAFVFVSFWQQYGFAIGNGVPYTGSYILRNAIEPIRNHRKSDDGRINFIYHTTPHRGLELLVPVFEKLSGEFKDIHLDVYSSFEAYGWPQRDEPYKPLFDRIRNHPNMTYHGYQPNDIVRKALENAHVFAYPCIWQETSCIAAIEAMSAGCHIIHPTYGALPETCGNFAMSYSFSEDHNIHANVFYHSVRKMIQTLRQDKSLFNIGLGMQKSYIDNYYNWDDRAIQWQNLLEGILSVVKQ